MRLLLARHPLRLEAKHPIIIEELLGLARGGQHEALTAMIEMLRDLYLYGRESRFVRSLQGVSLYELKTQSRGGAKGGSRIYFFLNDRDEAVVVNCEVKDDDTASTNKLKEAATVAVAYWKGIDVARGVRYGAGQD